MRRLVAGFALALLSLVFPFMGPETARAADPATDGKLPPQLIPSRAGGVGAWLALGPIAVPKDTDVASGAPLIDALAPELGAVGFPARGPKHPPLRWKLATTKSGAIDLREQLGSSGAEGTNVSYFVANLRSAKPLRATLLLGVTGAYELLIDGKHLATRKTSTGYTTDGDAIPLDLSTGRHTIVLKVLRTSSEGLVRTRFVTAALTRPEDLTFEYPGLTDKQAPELAARLASVHFARNIDTMGYAPSVRVRFAEGSVLTSDPHAFPLAIRVLDGETTTRFDAGLVPDDEGVTAHLPRFSDTSAATVEVTFAEKTQRYDLLPRPRIREALVACASLKPARDPDADASLAWEASRLRAAVERDERDVALLDREATELAARCKEAGLGADPFAGKTGPMRRAIVSPVDGEPSEFGLYVPPGYKVDSTRKYPLIVALHGLNGKPLAMLRWFFGGDDEHKDQNWEERHLEALPNLDAFVVTPSAHGNAMYRGLGEDDVLRVLAWVVKTYRIDERRVSITGPSMGGIGTAAIAFHHPDVFSAAAPLCGYHSTFVRGDVMGKRLRPWEQFLAEERSNASWAENGQALPLYIVHGKRDLPEANSGVLIERYEKLGYSIKHEHPDLGHNVWQKTYEDLKGAKWLLAHTRPTLPRHVHFRTGRGRFDKSYWLQVARTSSAGAWAEVEATRSGDSEVAVRSIRGVDELRIAPEAFAKWPATLTIAGVKLVFAENEPVIVHREDATFRKGPAATPTPDGGRGPIRDAWHDPLTFVYGTRNPAHAFANEQIATTMAQGRYGTLVHYPVMSDVEFEKNPMPDRSLVLIGRASENSVLAALEGHLPIKVVGDDVVFSNGKRFSGSEVGTMFVYPHPQKPARRIVVVEGATPFGTFRALSLPDLLPDFIVYDNRVAKARDHAVLGELPIRAAGFFKADGSLPDTTDEGMR